MRKILCLLLVLAVILGSITALSSCEYLVRDDHISDGNVDDLHNGLRDEDDKEQPSDSEDDPLDDEENNPDNGDDIPDNGDDTPNNGDDIPDNGDDTPNNGDDTPDNGDDTPDNGDDTPDNGDNPGGEGDKPDDEKVCVNHVDENNNDYCDICDTYVVVVLDFYVFNDLHGKFCDTSTQPGVDEIGTYLENMSKYDDNMILLSAGDMWQGSAESTLTFGKILVEWMNVLGFEAMTLGNHEFDWGEDAIRDNLEAADFPFLAINIYDKKTGKLADYCTPSVMIERDGIQIGVIGAIGDCYSSISSDMVSNVTFKVGNELTNLVKAESTRLRELGADLIVYAIHDDSSIYDTSLSNGYVDLVFEAHTHQKYVTVDLYNVYHIQTNGENQGLSHVEIAVNSANGKNRVTTAIVVSNSEYGSLPDHAETEAIEDKYADVIDYAYRDLGMVSKYYSDSQIEAYVAQLYLEAGLDKWGNDYNIVLGGGFLRTRSPYNLTAGIKKYADLNALFPFNNKLVLCSISGSNLKSKFINTSNSDYYIAMSRYGSSISISNSSRYYIVVDMYTAVYAPNGLTIVDTYDDTTFARDLLAQAIIEGRLDESGNTVDKEYTLTSIEEALKLGQSLNTGGYTKDSYYIKGTVTQIDNTNYGNLYIEDEKGNKLYIYGLYDLSGNKYGSMSDPPKVGDTIVVLSTVYRYSYSVVELKGAMLIEIIEN